MDTNKKRGCIISGGGAKGAWGVGVLENIHELNGADYDVIAGTSTGALMAPFVSINDYKTLKEAYTSITNKDIYSVAPVNRDGKIRVLNILWRFARNIFKRTATFGESKNLRKLIDTFFTEEDYKAINEIGKEVSVGVCEIRQSDGEIYYPSNRSVSYESLKDFMWASANAPFLFSILDKKSSVLNHNEGQYIDGGLVEVLPYKPVLENLNRGDHADIIVHRKPSYNGRLRDRGPVKDQVHLLQRSFSIMRDKIEDTNIEQAIDMAIDKGISLNVYYMHPYIKSINALNFNKEEMLTLYEAGLKGKFYLKTYRP